MSQAALARAFPQRFTDAERCGDGTYGIVYKVKCQGGREKAAKVYRYDESNDGLSVDVVREISAMTYLHHRNILAIDEFNVDFDSAVLIMPAMTHSLYEYLYKSRRTPKLECTTTKLRICKSICNGIAYMHNVQFVHRDLKPHNVLIDEDTLDVKISDFGSARRFIRGQALTMDITTLFYRPPEQLFGSNSYELSVDVWSLACTCMEIMRGIELFRSPPSGGKFTDDAQISTIFDLLGTRDMAWAMHPQYPRFNQNITKKSKGNTTNLFPTHMKSSCPECPAAFVDVMTSALQANPTQRVGAQQIYDTLQSVLDDPSEATTSLETHGSTEGDRLSTSDDDSSRRTNLIDWLIQKHDEFEFNNATLHLAIDIFDRYCANFPVQTAESQLVCIVALLIASKLNETYELRWDMMIACCNQYTITDFKKMEKKMFSGLQGNLMLLSHAASELHQISDNVLRQIVQYLFESSMLEKPQAHLRMKRAKKIRETTGCLHKIRDFFNQSTHASLRKKFGKQIILSGCEK